MTPAFEEITRLLGRIDTGGTFATRHTCGPSDLFLGVEGVVFHEDDYLR